MRDPKRIHRIITKLEKAWLLEPNWRLGQFLSNLKGVGYHDLFYDEDNEWEQLLDEFLGDAIPNKVN